MSLQMVIPLRMLVLCLLSGGMISLIVAWACALWMPWRIYDYPATPDEGNWHYLRSFGWLQAEPYSWRATEGGFLYWTHSMTPAIREAGLPLRCMRSTVSVVHDPNSRTFSKPLSRWELPWSEIVHRGIQTSDLPVWLGAQRARRVPLVPIWWAFLLNTLFYGMILCFAGDVWRKVRERRQRRRRGFDILPPKLETVASG